MKPETKTFAIILGYCSFLWGTNWSISHDYDRTVGITASSLDLRNFGTLFGIIASYVITRRIWRVIRILLDARIRIPWSIRLWGSWRYLLLLIPYAFGTIHHSSGTADDGAAIKTVFEYGGSWASPLFSGIAIMLFQLLIRLETYNPENQEAEQSASCNPLPAAELR